MLTVCRLRYQKKGFRAKLSIGWYVIDDVTGRPVAGPFDTKGLARVERDNRKGRVMTDRKIQESHSVEEVIDDKKTDQSDSSSARNTSDGSSPTDGREEEVIEKHEKAEKSKNAD